MLLVHTSEVIETIVRGRLLGVSFIVLFHFIGIKQHSESPTVQTPKRFFFGAVIDVCSPAVKHSPGRRRTRKDSLNLEELTACQVETLTSLFLSPFSIHV